MECNRGHEKRTRRRKKSFTEALKEKYCMEDDLAFDFIIVSPKRKTNSSAELAHLQTVVLNGMDITRADIPRQGLVSLCPNVVDLDLANNLLETWSELLSILSHLPKVRYLNVSRNKLRLDLTDTSNPILCQKLTVENLALNDTGVTIEEVVRLSQLMPGLKELHLCENSYDDLDNIETSIGCGAFSCLECLRLNNNEISRWSEVWKLRHLPHLKCLVLSGNPIDNVFYHSEDQIDNNPPITELQNVPEHTCESAKSASSSRRDRDCSMTGTFLPLEHTDSNMDINSECGSVLIHKLDRGDQACDNEELQPVRRFGFHSESASSSGSSGSDQDQIAESGSDDLTPSDSDSRFGLLTGLHADSSDPNMNNSCRGEFQKCLCDAYDSVDLGVLLNEDSFGNNNTLGGNSVEVDDWHRLVAEEFLHEIISGINFDDISDQTVPNFRAEEFNYAHFTSYNLEDAEDSSYSNAVSQEVRCSSESTDVKQIKSAENVAGNVGAFEDGVASTIPDGEFHLGYSGLSSDIDAQFIPRAVRLLDEELTSSFFYMATPSPPRSRVQRRLFQEASFPGNSNTVETDNTSYSRDSRHQSASDSCSDCEAEQHKHEKEADVKTPANICFSNNIASALPRSSLLHCQLEGSSKSACPGTHPQSSAHASPDLFTTAEVSSHDVHIRVTAPVSNCVLCKDEHNVESDNNNSNISKDTGHGHHYDNSYCPAGIDYSRVPFQHLQVLCLSSANIHHWNHLKSFTLFPKLTNMRLKNNPLYSTVNSDDRRKLYIASLPKVSVLNGSEVSHTEREKAERHFLRYFMDKEDKPEMYHTLVKKHGPPVKLVDIDLSAGYQEWANLKFVCKGVEEFTRKIHLVDPVGRLRTLIAQVMGLPKSCFIMHHYSCGPSHPESERELVELRCESLPMSRLDFADGDEIHIDVGD